MAQTSAEMTVFDIIKSTLPDGTRHASKGRDAVCEWPPDLFAAVAAITERCGLYSERAFMAYWTTGVFALTKQWIDETRKAGKQ
jgi:hypothetical protein